jgi:FkbM family methyltransferase
LSLSGYFRAAKRFGRGLKPYLRAIGANSYSQYCEDAMLFNAMKPGRRGFYVDVGAYDPIEGSNTYKLYRRGWSGLTIEPNPGAAWKFAAIRPRDMHLVMGISREPASLRYYAFDIAMLNTTDAARARSLEQSGFELAGTRDIHCEPLNAVLERHAPDRHVDVLNVDCEGLDLAVLQSLDFAERRPTVVIVEDLDRYYEFAGPDAVTPIARFMREQDYTLLAQLLFTSIYVSRDWRELNRRSGAFREKAIHPGVLRERLDEST